jgi:hypothetical protein
MSENNQSFLINDDSELLTERRALGEKQEARRSYEAARKQAWDSGVPFPEDREKWAFSFYWWRGATRS